MVTLESNRLFVNLAPSDLAAIKSAARELRFQPGQSIFRQGDAGDGIYIIQDGRVKISVVIGGEDNRAFSYEGPGALFGEMAVLDDGPRSASASAEEETLVSFLPRAAVLEMVQSSPALARNLMREVIGRLREFNHQYIRELIQAERLALVGRFTRSIVHDLKNPLNIIGIAAELAGMESSSIEARQSAKSRIRKQVERITNLINEVLEFTRGSQTSFILALTDYSKFVNQLTDEIRPEAALRSVNVEFENQPPAVKVPMNPDRLNRVFFNLLHNAADAMPDGGTIKLRFGLDEKYVTTEIEDCGSGIAPEIMGSLFEAFATHGKTHGTGLGLSICKRIIEDHRGQIGGRNVPGGGALFFFTLPIHR